MKQDDIPQHPMVDMDKRIAGLSPEKRALLYKRMARAGNKGAPAPSPDPAAGERIAASPAYAPQAIRTRLPGEVLPLSFAQQRLWFVDRLLPDKSAYNVSMALRLQGPLDRSALQRSLQALLLRHESLRTRFTLRAAEPEQRIDPAHEVALPITDLSSLETSEREVRMREITNAAARKPFDLESGPLLRALLLRLDAEEHVLLINIHHIAFDGWSMVVFNHELSTAYAAFAQGTSPRLPDLPIQYADYALWQRQWLQGEALQGQLAYWKHKLEALATLELPTDRVRPAVQSYRGARITCELPARLGEALKALGRREGATLFMTLLAAFKVLLYRYSGQEDIVVGTPIAARRRTELEALIGFFANTLVLRTELCGNPSFRELLARVRETALGAYTHQDLPFEKLVEELAPARDLSRNPLFQVMFVLQNTWGDELELHGLRSSRLPLDSNTAKFDLMFTVCETPRGLRTTWEYAADLFDAATIERMAANFQVLLEGIAADPSTPIAALPILSPAERAQLLVQWNHTASAYPSSQCIHQLFEAQAQRHPQAVALVEADRQLTYAELNARANRLAHHLVGLGVGPEVLVGVCLERSIELVVALLAILKAGGAYVPLDPAYPNERLAFMLEDTKAPVLISAQALTQRLVRYAGKLLCLDRDQDLYANQPDTNPERQCHPDQLAYVIYTSGSTGKPKGILLPHATLVNLVSWHRKEASGGRVAQFTPISFDVSLQEILHALCGGAALVVVDTETRMRPEKLAGFLRQHEITALFAPNVVLEYLAHAVVAAKLDLPALCDVYQAGEALTITPAIQALFYRHGGSRLHNHYGPAESHVVTASTLPADPQTWPYRPVIGRPIANTRIYLLDRHQQPVPIGVPGEVCVGGAGLARGYLNRDELTRERFLPDPFAQSPGQRIYRSGDLARYLPDGNIEYLGRIDDQLKIRGFRIEPGEIETVLAEHPSLRQAVVIAREDTPGDKRLVAYVVAADRCSVDVEALRALLRERLPEYMRPGTFVVIDALPLTANGKIDRKALPAPSTSSPPDSTPRDAEPRDRVERILCAFWAQTLGVERVGLDDNFFQIGGHSLLAATLFSRLDAALNRTLPLATLFESPTIRELARFYRGSADPVVRSALVPIRSAGSLPPVFGVPGVGGNVLGFAELAHELGAEQPFFGLQSIGLDGQREPLQTIEHMAREYIQELRQEQAEGPYYLLGACFGSAVAFEMAHQLADAGETVAFLGLIDPSLLNATTAGHPAAELPSSLHRGVALARFVAARLRLYRDGMRILGFRQRMRFLFDKAQLLGKALQKRDLFRGDRREFHQRKVADTNLRAMFRHKHHPLRGRVKRVEIFASEPRYERLTADARAAWSALAGKHVVYHRMAGRDSGDVVQGRHAKGFAEVFVRSLQQARQETAGTVMSTAHARPAQSPSDSSACALDLGT